MVMPNNNPKDHYETAKVPWKKIREISKQYYEDKETLRKNNRNWCRGFSQEKYGRIKRIWKTIQKNYAWRRQTTKERIHERTLERLKKSSIQPCDEENKRKWKIMK